jgi:outer membrane protein TolC
MAYQHMLKLTAMCTLVLCSDILHAQVFDTDSAVAHALEHNPNLNAVHQQVNASGARTQASRAGHKPVLSISHTARVSDNPLDAFADKLNTRQVTTPDFDPARLNDPGSSDLYFTQLALRWPVYTGGRVSALVEDAEHTEANSRLQYQYQREHIAAATLQAYRVALAAEQAVAIAEDAVRAALQHANTTAELAAEGRIVESDKLAAEVNLAALRSQREQAATRYQSALDELKLVIGLPLDTAIELAAAKLPVIAEAEALAAHEKRALDARKDLAAARAMVQAAKARVDAARSVNRPTVDIVASSNWYDDSPGFDSQSSSIMGVISFDLYNGKTDGEIDVALAQQREMQWQLQALEQVAQKQVRDAWNSMQESKQRLALAEDNVFTAKRTVKLVKQRYGQGRTILLDLLQSERLYTDARIEKLTAHLNLDLARIALPLASGTLQLPAGVSP